MLRKACHSYLQVLRKAFHSYQGLQALQGRSKHLQMLRKACHSYLTHVYEVLSVAQCSAMPFYKHQQSATALQHALQL